jgi:hypothetical protein
MRALDPLYEAKSWGDRAANLALLAELRAQEPICFYEKEGYVDLWHITRHADIFEVEKQTDSFIVAPRMVLMPTAREETLKGFTGGTVHIIKSLVSIDPPEHPPLRMLTQGWFMPKNLARLQGAMEASAETALNRLAETGGACDFAQDVALEYPLRVIMAALGIPAADYPQMLKLTQELFSPEDPDVSADEKSQDEVTQGIIDTFMEFYAYFTALTADRKANPRDDLASVIANAEIDGEPIGEAEQLGYYIITATAGHDTTSFSLSEAIWHLAQNPDVFAELKADPATMSRKIVEESIRLASPVRHFLRTATRDIEIGGHQFRKGDTLMLWFPSGSRDETVFADPDRFDPHRDMSTRHASFGHGAHICLGMHLARQENAAFLERMAQRVKSIELTGEPEFNHSHFVGGIKHLPVRMELETD